MKNGPASIPSSPSESMQQFDDAWKFQREPLAKSVWMEVRTKSGVGQTNRSGGRTCLGGVDAYRRGACPIRSQAEMSMQNEIASKPPASGHLESSGHTQQSWRYHVQEAETCVADAGARRNPKPQNKNARRVGESEGKRAFAWADGWWCVLRRRRPAPPDEMGERERSSKSGGGTTNPLERAAAAAITIGRHHAGPPRSIESWALGVVADAAVPLAGFVLGKGWLFFTAPHVWAPSSDETAALDNMCTSDPGRLPHPHPQKEPTLPTQPWPTRRTVSATTATVRGAPRPSKAVPSPVSAGWMDDGVGDAASGLLVRIAIC